MKFKSKELIKPKTIFVVLKTICIIGVVMYAVLFLITVFAGDFDLSKLGALCTAVFITTAFSRLPFVRENDEDSLAEIEFFDDGFTVDYLQLQNHLKNRVYRVNYDKVTKTLFDKEDKTLTFFGGAYLINAQTKKKIKKIKEYTLHIDKKNLEPILEEIKKKIIVTDADE